MSQDEMNRASIIDHNFTWRVSQQQFPKIDLSLTPQQVGLSKAILLDIFQSQLLSRHLDLQARELQRQGLGFYTIGSSGHEANAAIAQVFRVDDMAFLHYRSGAFFLQRSKKLGGSDGVRDTLLSLMASKNDPIAAGRHKVFGSKSLFIPPQTSTIASHLPKAMGFATSIQRAHLLKIESVVPADSVVLCSFGDASFNHSTALGAFNSAQRLAHSGYPLPLVFICEDNGLGVSVPTPADWIEKRMSAQPCMHYIIADGLHPCVVYQAAKQAEHIARIDKKPVFLHLKMRRLLGHAGSDVELLYRDLQDIERDEFYDPLLVSARVIVDNDYLTAEQIMMLYEKAREEVAQKALELADTPHLNDAEQVMQSIIPPILNRSVPSAVCGQSADIPLTMAQQINRALNDLMQQYPQIIVFGEDVAKKGGVYHVTADLQKQFGQARVFDTILDEQSILGQAIGHAQNGFLPIPEIQFLAYLHNAEDQLRGEAATLSFFSNGQYTNPMVIRIAGLAYQKGFGGHFHNDNSFAVLRDIPGVIVACPANGEEATLLLRECLRLAYVEQRVVVFLEPIALYHEKDLYQKNDHRWMTAYPALERSIRFGEFGVTGDGRDVLIITYGNGYYLSRKAQTILAEQHNIAITIINLRWLVPLAKSALLEQARQYQRILVVDECRETASLSEQIISLFAQHLNSSIQIQCCAAKNSFIPLGAAMSFMLPSCEQIVQHCLAVLSSCGE